MVLAVVVKHFRTREHEKKLRLWFDHRAAAALNHLSDASVGRANSGITDYTVYVVINTSMVKRRKGR